MEKLNVWRRIAHVGIRTEMPAQVEWALTTTPQLLAWVSRVVIYHGDR